MLKFSLPLISIIFFFISINIFPQGAYLDKGQSGFGIGAAFPTNKDISGFGGSASYCFSGIVDLGLFVGRFSLEEQLAGYDVNAIAISPFINIYVIKQDEDIPISIAIGGTYESDSYSSEALDILNWELSGSYFSFGGSIFGNLPISTTGKIQPSIGVSYVTGESKVEDNSGNSVTSDNNITNFDIALSLFFKTSSSTFFRLTPVVAINKNNTTFALGVGAIFSTN